MDLSIFQINIEHQSMYLKMQENCGWINEQFFDKNLIHFTCFVCGIVIEGKIMIKLKTSKPHKSNWWERICQ